MTRLDGDERRKAIVAAAVPLFARKGFAGTTTKELAEAAGISEALLFRHFPSKKHLYDEILRLGCEGDPALERLAILEPSTETLVHMIHFMVRYFLLGAGVDAIFPGSPFERRFRDIHTLSQQIQSHDAHYETVGQVLFGNPPEVFF